MLVDTHCHVQIRDFDKDRADILKRAAQAGVTSLVCVGYDPSSWRRAQELVHGSSPAHDSGAAVEVGAADGPEPRLYATAGLHPHDAKDLTPALLDEIRALIGQGRIVAVGECGLDFYRDLSTREQQREAFAVQIELAKEAALPLVVHDREAHESVAEMLREQGARSGILHCFSGDWDFARACLDLGFYLSIAGPVTYRAAEALRDVVRRAPLERLLVETDCPFLTPHPFRGKRNEPALVRLVAEEVARVREMDLEDLATATSENARAAFGIA